MATQWQKRLIDEHYADSSNVVARCHLLAHRGYLSKTLMKSHDCIAKKCPFFEKLKPEFWEAVEAEDREKKSNRLNRKQMLETKNERDALIRATLEDSGSVYITRIREERPNLLVISFIYDRRIDLTSEIQFLRVELKTAIRLQAIDGTEEAIEQLIRKPRRESRKVTSLRKAPKVGAATVKRLASLGVYCLEDLFGQRGEMLYMRDCKISGQKVNRRYLAAYQSAVEFANKVK